MNKKKSNKKSIATWAKRIITTIAITLWIIVLYKILQRGNPFNDQGPQCIVSTMVIFGILIGIHKGLEHWEEK